MPNSRDGAARFYPLALGLLALGWCAGFLFTGASQAAPLNWRPYRPPAIVPLEAEELFEQAAADAAEINAPLNDAANGDYFPAERDHDDYFPQQITRPNLLPQDQPAQQLTPVSGRHTGSTTQPAPSTQSQPTSAAGRQPRSAISRVKRTAAEQPTKVRDRILQVATRQSDDLDSLPDTTDDSFPETTRSRDSADDNLGPSLDDNSGDSPDMNVPNLDDDLPAPRARDDVRRQADCTDDKADCAAAYARIKNNSLANIDLSIAISGVEGLDYPCECPFAVGETFEGRDWPTIVYHWKASGLCHKPLYFEQVAVERYGHSALPVLQDIISGAHFFASVVVLPYSMGLCPPDECQYSLGYYRPGNCAPYLIDPIPLSMRAGLFQASAIVGGILILP